MNIKSIADVGQVLLSICFIQQTFTYYMPFCA
jgi:hypothetical protein